MISNRYVFFGVAVLSTMMFSIDGTTVAVALPTLMGELNTSIALVGWTLTAYQLGPVGPTALALGGSPTGGRSRRCLPA